MSNWDFENDSRNYDGALAKGERGLKTARTRLGEILESWPQYVGSYFLHRVTLDMHESGQRLSGTVLGKPFTVEFNTIFDGSSSEIELILWVPALVSGDPVELGRLLLSPNGSILDSSKKEILSWEDEFQPFKLLVGIIRKVMGSPATL